MNYAIKLILLFFLFALAKSDDPIYPSLRYGLSTEQIKDIEVIISEFLNNKEIPIQGVYYKEKVDFLGTVEFNMTDATFKFINLTEKTLTIQVGDDNHITFVLNDANAEVNFNYTFKSNFYSNEGKATLLLKNATLTIVNKVISIQNKKEPNKKGPGVEIESLAITSAKIEFVFEHEGALEKIIEFIIINIKDAFIEIIQKKFNDSYRPIFNKELADYLSNTELSFPINGTSLTVSYSMNEEPMISKEGIEMSFEAEIYSDKCRYPGKTYNIPHITKSTSTIDIILSQFIIDNYLYIMYNETQFETTLKSEDTYPMNLTVSTFTDIFPGLATKYNTSDKVDLKIKGFKAPIAAFSEEKTKIKGYFNIGIYVRTSETESELAVAGDAVLDSDVNFSIQKGVIKLEIASLTVEEFKNIQSNIGDITEEEVLANAKQFIGNYLIWINLGIAASVAQIKIPSIGNIHLDQTDITVHEHYLAIGVSPYIEEIEEILLKSFTRNKH